MPRKYAAYGKLLKYYRELANLKIHPPWSQSRIAKALNVSPRTYAGWEGGESLPSPEDLRNFVAVLELSEEEEKTLYRSVAQVPPEIDNLPFKQNPFFTGRKRELEQLRKQLQETGTAAITQPISITGLGGIGKTELALEFAHGSYPNVYRAALWVNAADESTLQASYGKLAEMLMPERTEQKLDRRVQAVKDWLKTHTNWLLIMDNADDLPLAESFLPAKPLGHVVFTTRLQDIDNIATNQIDIDKMELEDGLDFLLRRSRNLQVDADTRKAALEVVELLGGHPLALDQAGAYIQGTRISFTDYVARYRIERSQLLNKRRSLKSQDSEHSRHPLPVAATLELSIKEAGVQHPLATDILDFCAFLQPDATPEELFAHDDSFKYGTTEFDDAIAALHSYSLIKRNTQEKIFSMHRLVQAVLTDAMSPDLQQQWRDRVVRALNASFPEPEYSNWSQCERLLPHALVCAMYTEQELTLTQEALELFHKSGSYLLERGQYLVAEMFLKRVSIFAHYYGVEHPNIASVIGFTKYNLAVIYFAGGHFYLAEPLYQQALSILEKRLGTEHPETAKPLCNLATLYTVQGKYGQAESLLVRAHFILEKRLGTEHPETAKSLHGMAFLCYKQRKYGQSESLYRRVIMILEKHLGAEHPDNADPLYGLALLLREQGQHEQAEALSQRALSIREQRFGATRLHIQDTMRDYANSLHSIGIGHDAEVAALAMNDMPFYFD